MLLMREPDLLDLLIGTLKATNTFMINPNPNIGLNPLLHGNDPAIPPIHRHNIIRMSLQKHLFPRLNILSNEYATSTIVNFIILK